MSKKLTKEDLIRNNIKCELDEAGQPIIYSYGRKAKNSKVEWFQRFPPLTNVYHKYGKNTHYFIISLNLDGKRTSLTVSRIIHAWFKGEVPENYDVDHIDGNTYNNRPDNLQILTRRENLAKRLLSQSEIYLKWHEAKRNYKE